MCSYIKMDMRCAMSHTPLQGRPSLIALLQAQAFSAGTRPLNAAKLVVSVLFIAIGWLLMLQGQGIDASRLVIGVFFFAVK